MSKKVLSHDEVSRRGGLAVKKKHPNQFREMANKRWRKSPSKAK